MAEPPLNAAPSAANTRRFMVNVLWTWAGVIANIVVGLLLSPYVIRKLGPEGYGLWALLFSLVGYYGLMDLGFRSALIFYSAHFRARNESRSITELVNTVLFFYTLAALPLILLALVLARNAARVFRVSPAYVDDFSLLIVLLAASWVCGVNVFSACLEGFQSFKISSRIFIATTALRAIGSFALLASGFGLLALGLNYIAIQVLSLIACYIAFRRVFPELRLTPAAIRFRLLKQVAGYGIHTFVASIGSQFLAQGPVLVIGMLQPVAHVGYFSLPSRLLSYAGELIARAASVTASRATELAAQDRKAAVYSLALYANRYCFLLFMPLTVFLLLYGRELILRWIGPEFALYSAPLLPVLTVGVSVTLAGQFNSSSILFSLQQQRPYAHALVFEAVFVLLGLFLIVPRSGIYGAAWITAVMMVLVRALYTPWLLCRALGQRLAPYLAGIFLAPVLTALPVAAAVYFVKRELLSGATWLELIAAGALTAVFYYSVAFFTCLAPNHRAVVLTMIGERLGAQRHAP